MNEEKFRVMLCIDQVVWEKLASVLDAHPGESLHDPTSPRWTSRDVYAHMARWLNHSNACIEAYCAGGEPPKLEAAPDEMNSRWQQEDKPRGCQGKSPKSLYPSAGYYHIHTS